MKLKRRYTVGVCVELCRERCLILRLAEQQRQPPSFQPSRIIRATAWLRLDCRPAADDLPGENLQQQLDDPGPVFSVEHIGKKFPNLHSMRSLPRHDLRGPLALKGSSDHDSVLNHVFRVATAGCGLRDDALFDKRGAESCYISVDREPILY